MQKIFNAITAFYTYITNKRLSKTAVFALTAVACVCLNFFVFYLQFYNTTEIRQGLSQSPFWVFFLNYSPTLIFALFILFITGRFSVSLTVTTLFFTAFALVNRTKVKLRNDPIIPTDFSLGAEAFNTASKIEGGMPIKYFLLFGLIITGGAALIVFIKNKPFGFKFRLFGVIITALVFFIFNTLFYADKNLYERLPVVQRYNLVSHYNTKGMTYAFLYQANSIGLFKKRAPMGFNKEAIEAMLEQYPPAAYEFSEKPPHIIVIMAEAFSDISNLGVFEFNPGEDPLEHFNRITNEGVAGHIVVPHMGGGTADTEFEFLTGFSKREEEALPYAFRAFSKSADSLARTLNELSYNSIFVHPGASWFYSRAFVYDLLGFNELYFDEYFEGAPDKGGYINEDDTIEGVIRLFDNKMKEEPAKPVFLFCVTIQNHGPYEDKYADWEQLFAIANMPNHFTGKDINTACNYFLGVKDQDINIKRLTDYMNSLSEPAVLLYFGDHMPSMPNELIGKMGIEFDYDTGLKGVLPLFTTPFLLWGNAAANEKNAFNPDIIEPQAAISANFLGSVLLDSVGFGSASPINGFLNELRLDIPITTKYDFVTSQGYYKSYDELSFDERTKIDLYKHLQYYKLYKN